MKTTVFYHPIKDEILVTGQPVFMIAALAQGWIEFGYL